jgi:hypothetical protein
MNNIVGSKKMENDIVVFWMEKKEKKYESFNYSEMIDMKIKHWTYWNAQSRTRLTRQATSAVFKNNPDS